MKKMLMASAATLAMVGAASAEDVKLGILIGFTGPIESLTGHMAAAAENAMAEVNASGKAPNGWNFVSARGDSTCADSALATAAAELLAGHLELVRRDGDQLAQAHRLRAPLDEHLHGR